jgi:uncharacterized protein YerC
MRSRLAPDSRSAYSQGIDRFTREGVRETLTHLNRLIVDGSKIALLRSQGHSWREITEETGISKGTAQRTVSSLPQNV